MKLELWVTNQHQAALVAELLATYFSNGPELQGSTSVSAKPVVAGNTEQPKPSDLSKGGDLAESTNTEAGEKAAASVAPVTTKRSRKVKEEPVAPDSFSGSGAKLTIDAVREALQAYTERHDMAKGIALLSEHGARRISELPESTWAAFVEECSK
jgi:hypothetical protein